MKIGFLTTASGGSPLVVGLEIGFKELGHGVQPFRRGVHFDAVLIFNQSAHRPDYVYPEFPRENVPFAFIDTAEYGYFKRFDGAAQKHANAFSGASLDHDTKNRAEQLRLLDFLRGRSFPYFIREMSIYVKYPTSYHAIDYPVWMRECPPQPPRAEQYLKREVPLFLSWGASHPWRLHLTAAMRVIPTRKEVLVIEENGTPRMPYPEYCAKLMGSMCSVSFDGYGSGSFRTQEVATRCLLVKGPLFTRFHEPLIGGVHCVEYHIEHTGEDFHSTDIGRVIQEAIADPKLCYRIHEASYYHCMKHYTPRATAQRVLNTIAAHDWNKPTQLEL